MYYSKRIQVSIITAVVVLLAVALITAKGVRNGFVGSGVSLVATQHESQVFAADTGAATAHEEYQLVNINVDSIIGAPFVLPHSRVDLVSTPQDSESSSGPEPILKSVLVVGGEQFYAGTANGPDERKNILTLLLTPAQAQKLHLAKSSKAIRLIVHAQ